MLLSKLIDYYALYDLHKDRSKENQYHIDFDHAPTNIDRDVFFEVPSSLADIDLNITSKENGYSIGEFGFESLRPSGDHPNDYVRGESFLNEVGNKPNVIFVHGWRMKGFDRVKKIFHDSIMNNLGWNMYYYTLPYHLERQPEASLYSGEFMVSANINRTVESTRQAIVDLRALIQWMKNNKQGPVIIIGVSLGGFISNLVATLESEIDALVSIFYSNRLSYSIWNTIPGKYIRRDLESHGVNYNDLVKYWELVEPNQALPKINKENILLISAKHDQYVHIQDADLLWESWGKPTRYVYNCGHAGIVLKRKKIEKDTISFLQNKLKR
ncbi:MULTISPECIES: alpha/beta hydrolase [Bacillaceae]|uniref:Alpha/beta hydrolase family protein n=1 Tax=Priestia flexa TaxID=86664 RepID=A0ABU4J537_9BACI|nr:MULTISPECIES: alpha/beta hydrolase family protein [Bacillaceae]MCA1203311.1 alpha/beta hydrolase family protein [Priestia flexa]MDE8676544.1 alpha/beta hydrolase family protein [Priestia aryabhattai]MDT0149886.1 alpha/beta hydrolase family protein [Priestia aryabhattai]MDT0155439.1 alpha/beta hydrolase family protein [Priestia aryabhattai]MDW8516112.1 alpha/beta hydrolase family protein [Priestia flexa]